MKLKFKAEDFVPNGRYPNLPIKHQVAAMAQEVFDKWLSEQQTVYGTVVKNYPWTRQKLPNHDCQAKLVCIEEIEKKPCEHEPETIVSWDKGIMTLFPSTVKCAKCGKKLKAKWEEA